VITAASLLEAVHAPVAALLQPQHLLQPATTTLPLVGQPAVPRVILICFAVTAQIQINLGPRLTVPQGRPVKEVSALPRPQRPQEVPQPRGFVLVPIPTKTAWGSL
jgi:hypothetical protein